MGAALVLLWTTLDNFPNSPNFHVSKFEKLKKIEKFGNLGKHTCAVATPLGIGAQIATKKRIRSAQVSPGGVDIFVPRWLLCGVPLLTNVVCFRIYY